MPGWPARSEVLKRVGDMRQLAAAELVEAQEGSERGGRKAVVTAGSGLAFTVHVDRGLDIGEASFRGVNLTWRSPVGAARSGTGGWLRRFPGGLLTTCGLDNVGPPEGERTLHGRHSGTPARLLRLESFWEGASYVTEILGEVRDYALFGPNLALRRRIRTRHDRAELTVRDRVTNEGYEPQPLMLLYHCNFGYPLLDEGSTLESPGALSPRDGAAEAGLSYALKLHGPEAGYAEQVFHADARLHNLGAEDGVCTVRLHNAALGVGVGLRFAASELPHFTLWKQFGEGAYVLGLEPGTCGVLGYARERELGRVVTLAPGASYETGLTFTFEAATFEAVP